MAFNNVVFMADGRNDPVAHIAVIQAAVVASLSLFTDVSIPLSLSLTLLIIQSLLHPACPSLLLFSSVLKQHFTASYVQLGCKR